MFVFVRTFPVPRQRNDVIYILKILNKYIIIIYNELPKITSAYRKLLKDSGRGVHFFDIDILRKS